MTRDAIAIIWNPVKIDRSVLEEASLDAGLSSHEAEVVLWLETSEDDPGQGAAAEAIEHGARLLIVAGGDGTVRAVLEHVAGEGAEVEVALVPLGTGNLLARNLDVPIDDRVAAMRKALTHEARPIDVGWLETDGVDARRQAFAVMAGFGIDAQMIAETDDDLKGVAGWLAYVESLGRATRALDTVDVAIALDGESVDDAAHTVIVGNCGTLQGGLRLLPDAEPDDGLLDVLVLHADDAAGWLDTVRSAVWDNGIRRLIRGDDEEGALGSDHVSHRRGREVRLELASAQPFEIDGEVIGDVSSATMSVQHGAVRIR